MSGVDDMTPDELARACADNMWRDDNAVKALGFTLDHVASGEARMSVTVGENMTNGHKICHGGLIFTLADSAFAYACNGYNLNTVAQHCSITFIAPAYQGDRITAVAREQTRFGRNGIYDITIAREDGTEVARFRGHSRNVRGTHIPVDEPGDTRQSGSRGG